MIEMQNLRQIKKHFFYCRSNEYLPLNSTQEYATASSGDKNHKESYPLQSEMDLGDLIDVFSKQKTISSPPVDRTVSHEKQY